MGEVDEANEVTGNVDDAINKNSDNGVQTEGCTTLVNTEEEDPADILEEMIWPIMTMVVTRSEFGALHLPDTVTPLRNVLHQFSS